MIPTNMMPPQNVFAQRAATFPQQGGPMPPTPMPPQPMPATSGWGGGRFVGPTGPPTMQSGPTPMPPQFMPGAGGPMPPTMGPGAGGPMPPTPMPATYPGVQRFGMPGQAAQLPQNFMRQRLMMA